MRIRFARPAKVVSLRSWFFHSWTNDEILSFRILGFNVIRHNRVRIKKFLDIGH